MSLLLAASSSVVAQDPPPKSNTNLHAAVSAWGLLPFRPPVSAPPIAAIASASIEATQVYRDDALVSRLVAAWTTVTPAVPQRVSQAFGVVALTPLSGQIVFTGGTPSVTKALVPSSGQTVQSGNAPTVRQTLVPTSGQVTFAGNTPSITKTLVPTSGQVVFAGNAPTLNLVIGYVPYQQAQLQTILRAWQTVTQNQRQVKAVFGSSALTPVAGQVTQTGNVPSLRRTFVPTSGQVTQAGNTPTVRETLVPISGQVIDSGNAPTIRKTLVASSGQLVQTGNTPNLRKILVPTSGQVTQAGGAPTVSRILLGTSGQITVSGGTPTRPVSYTAGTGQLVLSGNAALLTYPIVPVSGQVEHTGNAPTLHWVATPTTGQVQHAGNVPNVYTSASSGLLVNAGNVPTVSFRLVPLPGGTRVTGNVVSFAAVVKPTSSQLVMEGHAPSISQHITETPSTTSVSSTKNVAPKVKPLYDYMVEGFSDRLFEVTGVRPLLLNSSDDVQALKKMREGKAVTYPFLVARNTLISIAQNRGKPLTYLRRGLLVNLAKNGTNSDITFFAKLDYVFELTFVTNRYEHAKQFAKQWTSSAVGGFLKFNIQYGLSAFEIGAMLDTNIQMPIREADPTNVGEYRVIVTATIRGYANEASWIRSQIANTVSVDGFVSTDVEADAIDGPNVNRQFMSFKK